jgi:hypothetical protein
MAAVATHPASLTKMRREKAREFRLILAVAFLYFLVVACVARLLPTALRPSLPPTSGRRSVIGEAKALAGTFVPFAFMR